MGFWNYPISGIITPSAQWMAELLEAQQAGGDLDPHETSQRAAKLPEPPYPTDAFPGHSAWVDGDWKLHRIEDKESKVSWEIYNLSSDPYEESNLAAAEGARISSIRGEIELWLEAVVRSLNGEDYARR
jgi:arylsulfatase A-like enzyme